MQFTALFTLVAAVFVAGTEATRGHASSSAFVTTVDSISSFAANATATFNGSFPGPSTVFGVPVPTGTASPGNGSFICFPVGAGFITDLSSNGTDFPTGNNGTGFPASGNGTNIPFPSPTASGGYNGSTTITLSDAPIATAFSA